MDQPSDKQVDMESRDAELAAAVMDYLVEFPKAMDTLKGIAEWWINRRKVRADVEDLMRVLGRLIDLGFLEQIGTGEGAHYRLRQN